MRALLLCASHNDLGLIRSLKKLGYEIICTGYTPGLVGEKYVDEYIRLDYSDREAVLALAGEKQIDAICQCCNDYGVYTAAYVAEKLGLKGYDSYETTLLLHNKDRFKTFAEKYNISTCQSFSFTSYDEAVVWAKNAKLPMIVKPVDASAGNGIHKIEKEEEIEEYIRLAFEKTRNGRILLEPFLEGTQHGFCTFLKDRKVIAWSSNNEYSMINPYRVEIDTFPSSDTQHIAEILIEQIEKIAEILNLVDGIFHLQYINVDGKPYILEVMRRILGNMYSVPASMLTGFDWDYWETRCRCGLSLDGIPTHTEREGFFAYKTVLAPANGVIRDIIIPEKYKKYLWYDFYIHGHGDEIDNHLSQPVGFLFLVFSTREEMEELLITNYDNAMVIMKED